MVDFVLQLFDQLLVLVLQGFLSFLVALVDFLDFFELLLQLGVGGGKLVKLSLIVFQERWDLCSHLRLILLHVLFNDMKECLDVVFHP